MIIKLQVYFKSSLAVNSQARGQARGLAGHLYSLKPNEYRTAISMLARDALCNSTKAEGNGKTTLY